MEQRDYLVLENVWKSFAGVPVLKGVNFTARMGEVHGLLGGNGAGKSTLMNVLGGIYSKDMGTIRIDGKTVEIGNAAQAEAAGISFIHQELKLFELRSVAENILLSRLPTKKPFGFVDDKRKNEIAKGWLDVVGADVAPATRLGDLSIAEQQQVEIAKALSAEARILIFDEPTSSLTAREAHRLFEIIRKLRADGVCIIYISHKFDEIFALCDRVTVLRDGGTAGTLVTAETDNDELVNLVIGRRLEQYFPDLPQAPGEDAPAALTVTGLSNKKLANVGFSLKKGEILGLFGLVGAGRSELARAVFGLDYVQSGEILVNGKPADIRSPRAAMKQGISFLTENRREEGLVLKMNILQNLTLPIIDRLTLPVIDLVKFKKENEMVEDAFRRFSIKATGPRQRVSRLSGGNQQKVVLSKWIMTQPNILILDEPTRGVDVGAKAEIYELIVNMVEERGLSVLLISSEAGEILGMCHRILLMRDGRVIGEYENDGVTEEELVAKCAGGDDAA